MKLRLFIIILLFMTFSCDDDDYTNGDVPSVVVNGFWTAFHSAKDVKIEKFGENFEAAFEIEDNEHKAVLSPQGSLLREKREVSFNSLPDEIQASLAAFGRKKIKDLEIVENGELIYYQAQLKRFLKDKKIILDQSGKENSSLRFWD